MILLRSEYISPRLLYVANYIFTYRMGLPCRIVLSDYVAKEDEFVVNYLKEAKDSFSVFNSNFLKEEKIPEFYPEFLEKNNDIFLFPITKNEFSFQFDVFSAVFYMISRYEEYLPYQKDAHARFDTQASFAFKHGFHERAVVDEWIQLFKQKLKLRYPQLKIQVDKFEYQITVDVDMAYSYLCKGFTRNAAAWMRDLFKGRFNEFFRRPLVLLHLMKDPYDTFSFIDEINTKLQNSIHFFVLTASQRSKYDKNSQLQCKKFRNLIKKLAENYPLALHPSYYSLENPALYSEEKQALEKICNKEISSSRQHYLRMKIPNSYEQLINNGFLDDYSMGFASIPGYRAGTSKPFPFFNLKTNLQTTLTIHPIALMDGSYKDYNALDNKEIIQVIEEKIAYLKSINGKFCLLIHNETLSESKRWKAWRTLLDNTIEILNKA